MTPLNRNFIEPKLVKHMAQNNKAVITTSLSCKIASPQMNRAPATNKLVTE